jgi:hypothetical protein
MFENESITISKKLLMALGLELQEGTNVCVDQDTKSIISFEDKFVKAHTNPDKPLYIDEEHEVKLSPLDPKCTKMLERFFGKFLNDSEEDENLPHCLTYYFDQNPEDKKHKLNVKFESTTMPSYEGSFFYNKILCYLEAIFKLDGTFEDIDLSIYDIQYDLLKDEDN